MKIFKSDLASVIKYYQGLNAVDSDTFNFTQTILGTNFETSDDTVIIPWLPKLTGAESSIVDISGKPQKIYKSFNNTRDISLFYSCAVHDMFPEISYLKKFYKGLYAIDFHNVTNTDHRYWIKLNLDNENVQKIESQYVYYKLCGIEYSIASIFQKAVNSQKPITEIKNEHINS